MIPFSLGQCATLIVTESTYPRHVGSPVPFTGTAKPV